MAYSPDRLSSRQADQLVGIIKPAFKSRDRSPGGRAKFPQKDRSSLAAGRHEAGHFLPDFNVDAGFWDSRDASLQTLDQDGYRDLGFSCDASGSRRRQHSDGRITAGQ